MNLKEIVPLEWRGQRVLTTKQLTQAFGYAPHKGIPNTFYSHKKEFTENVHYFKLIGDEIRQFKAEYPNLTVNLCAHAFYLWTKPGVKKLAARARMDGTLDIYEWLAENYFEQAAITEITAPAAEPSEETPAEMALTPVEYSGERILTTDQLAQFYECDAINIQKNFNVNKDRFVEGKHYFKVEGEALSKLRLTESKLQISPMTRAIYLWTKRGAARHAKMLSTDMAWQVFEMLEDSYFESTKITPASTGMPIKPSEMVWEIGATRDAIKQVFKIEDEIREGMALAQATDMVTGHYGVDFPDLKKLIPPATHDVGFLTPTMIGAKMGKTAQDVNAMLRAQGLQYKDKKGNWHLTAAGTKYGEMIPYMNKTTGHSGYYIAFNEKVFEAIGEPSLF